MKRLLFAAAFTLMAVLTTDEASAQRSRHQRINHGVRSGQLTVQEARQLRVREVRLREAQRMAMADGFVSPRERAYIAKLQRSNSMAIYNQKHDRQQRW